LAEFEQARPMRGALSFSLARHRYENTGNNLQKKPAGVAVKLPFSRVSEFDRGERGGAMDSNTEREKMNATLYWRAAGTFALAICLGALPLLAGQDQQGGEASTTQEPAEQAAPEQAPPAPSADEGVPSVLGVPAGTIITVRTSQYLSSDQNQPGDGFTAELEQPLVVDGWVVARRGQTVLGRVVTARKAGRIKGNSELGVELSQLVLVDGQQIPIRTQLMQTSAGAAHREEATAVGGSAGIGAIIGAAADGGKGAAIGAASGAAAALGGILLTRGRPTEILSETVLTFQLQNPLTISTTRSYVAFRPAAPEDYEGRRTLQRRTENFAVPPPRRPAPYWGGYYPRFYPAPLFVGVYRFGGRHHRRW
jgi:hypothetical protein